jgi:1-acyl-sn-glycerol-3-phosphate acyltransferase
LWLSQAARNLADNALRMFAVLLIAAAGQAQSDGSWHQVTLFFILPFIVLGPVDGAISNSLPRRWVLVGSAAWCLGVALMAALFVAQDASSWLWCSIILLNSLGAAVYSPARYALLPAAAEDTQLPLSRVTGWIEMGSAAAVVTGLIMGWYLHEQAGIGIRPAMLTLVGLNLVSVVAALPVWFASDTRRPETPGRAIAGFFRDYRRIATERLALDLLLGLASLMAVLTAGAGAMLAYTGHTGSGNALFAVPKALALISLGVAVGSLLAGWQGHPRRVLGLVPLGLVGLLGALAWAATSADLAGPALLLGIMGGLANVPLRSVYLATVPADARGNGMAVMNTAIYTASTVLAVVFFALARSQVITAAGQLWLLAGLVVIGALLAWRMLLRETLEQILESLLWPSYRVRVTGPGLQQLPRQGPLVIIANHTAWFDPLWLAKVLPRQMTPMMTSVYFDLPVLRWLMGRVVGAIRVPAVRFRREAPELRDAVGVLDRGGCLMIFPEGSMKRKPEQTLRQFGQGIWRILQQRPKTPVVVCWIEGGWGSFTSYDRGRPLRNKPLDWWRPIDIALAPPQVLDPDVLADQRATRTFLMRACLETRRYLGLEPLPMIRQMVAEAADEGE